MVKQSNVYLSFFKTLILFLFFFQGRRSPEQTAEVALFREDTDPEKGGKVPEAAHMRRELNNIDTMGFNNPAVPGMIAAMEDMPLPDKIPENFQPHGHPAGHSAGHHGGHLRTGASSFIPPRPQLSSFPDFHAQFSDFPFNPAFDAHKINPEEEIEFSNPRGFGTGREFSGNSVDVYEQKPHLYTADPYANPEPHYAADPYKTPAPYHPPSSYHEPAPYHPEPAVGYHEPESYHEPEPYHEPVAPYHETPAPYHPPSSYHEPEPYHPPTSGYHEPEPAYGPPPADGYGVPHPYKPKGPVMLKERPYEPKEVKPVTITTHDTYTAFDCRKVPYPDRHYADPEAGCQVSPLFINARV